MTEETLEIRLPEKMPNHYEVLGIRLFESDIGIIHEAGFKRFTEFNRLLSEAKSSNEKKSIQDLLDKLSQACTTLEIPEKKESYDEKLAEELDVDLEEERRKTYVNRKLDGDELKQLQEADKQLEEITTDSGRILRLKQPTDTGPVLRLAKKKKTSSTSEPKGRTERIENFRNQKPKFVGPQKTEVILFDEKNTGQNAPGKNEALLKQGNTTFTIFKCENCGGLMSQWAAICIECGYDRNSQKVIKTKKIKPKPPILKTGLISRAIKDLMENVKKTVAALISFLLLIFVTFACVLFILKITSKRKFLVDSKKTIVSSEWGSAMNDSKFWSMYFDHRRFKGDSKPYVKLHLQTEVKQDLMNMPQKIYSLKIEDLKNNEILYQKSVAMAFNPNISEKIDEKTEMIREIMDEAAKHAILKRAQQYPELLTGEWGEDNSQGIKGAVDKLKKAINK